MKDRNRKIKEMLDEQNLSPEERKEAEKLSEQVLKKLEEEGVKVDDEDEEDNEESSGNSGNMTEQYIKKIREEKIKAKIMAVAKPVEHGFAVIGLITTIWWVIKLVKGHSVPTYEAIGTDIAGETVTTVAGSADVASAVTEAGLSAGAESIITNF